MRTRVTCVGEAIVDFVSTRSGTDLAGAPAFEKAPGGAPANVAVALVRLGTPASFVGAVGADPFGKFLARSLSKEGVETGGLVRKAQYRTRLAFVALGLRGERDFTFCERHPADEQLRPVDVDLKRLGASRIVHISSFLLLKEPARSTALRLARLLKKGRCLLSFDPNHRPSLWSSQALAKSLLVRMARHSDILRLNEEEAQLLSGRRRTDAAADALLELGPRLVIITAGESGCRYRTAQFRGSVRAFPVKAVDTTGCGDAFLAGILHGLSASGSSPENLTEEELRLLCLKANAVGALTSLTRGAWSAPRGEALDAFLKGAR